MIIRSKRRPGLLRQYRIFAFSFSSSTAHVTFKNHAPTYAFVKVGEQIRGSLLPLQLTT